MEAWIRSPVFFSANKNDGNIWAEMCHFWEPSVFHIIQTVWIVHWETHKKDICIWIGQGPESRRMNAYMYMYE